MLVPNEKREKQNGDEELGRGERSTGPEQNELHSNSNGRRRGVPDAGTWI